MNDMTMQKRGDRSPEKMQERREIAPAVDIFENKDEVLILADLPGVDKDDVTIHFEKNQLAIIAKRQPKEEGFDYARRFVLPNGIDAERISAEFTQGVLRLELPKSAAHKPRTIQVKAG
jgi:HSP20 family molecular chaperone IbpA